ncbi:MAG TPA: sugar ABC transporter permease [Spirochaetales bacterium]|nr:sugar ABC transporter permease [Spirochaetales bacterium]
MASIPSSPAADQGRVRKGPAIGAALASLLLPGTGQFINGQKRKGALWLALPILLLVGEFVTSNWGNYLLLKSGKVPPQALASMADEVTLGAAQSGGPQAVDLGALFGAMAEEESGPAEDLFGGDLFGGEDSEAQFFTPGSFTYPDYSKADKAYVVRDFGGFFTRGVWGLFTLGRLPIDAEYAGARIELYDRASPWMSADNSVVLLGNGLIAMAILLVASLLWAFGVSDAYRTAVKKQLTGTVEGFKAFWLRIWDSLYVYITSAPAFLLILMFTVIPIVYQFLLAFTNYTYRIKLGAKLIEWVGLDTFRFLALDPGWLSIFGQIFLWTVVWAFMSSFTVYALGFLNAMVVESPLVKGKKLWRTIMILPWAVPSLVSLMVFRNAFDKDGLVNQFLFASGLMEPVSNFLHNIGLAGQADSPIFWFQPIYNGKLARFVVVLVNLWLGAPYHMMMIIGVLSTLPRELYEAAEIDGATGFQRFRYITLPMVLAATVPALIMTFSFNFNNFGAVYFLTGGGPSWDPSLVPDSMRIIGSAMPGQTDILISWIYKLSFTKDFEQYNTAAVYSIVVFMLIGGFAVFSMLRSKSFKEEAGE